MATQLTYFLSPKFYFKRDGPIALGSIIADPFRPHLVLTAAEDIVERYPKIETFVDFDQSLTRKQDTNASMSAWLEFLQTANAKVAAAREKHRLDEYTMTSLETEYFRELPSLDEIQTRVKADRVRAAIGASRWLGTRQPVYMITGRKLASGFSAVHERGKQTSGDAEAGTSTITPAGNLAVKGSAAARTDGELKTAWKAGDELVFAYQLMKIQVKGWKGSEVDFDEYRHESALLSDNTENGESEDENDVDFEVEISATTASDLANATAEIAMTTVEVGEGEGAFSIVTSGDNV